MCWEYLQGLSHLFLTRRSLPGSPIFRMSKTEARVGGAPESPTCKKQSWDFTPVLWYLFPFPQCQPLNTPAPEQTSLAGFWGCFPSDTLNGPLISTGHLLRQKGITRANVY